MPALAALRPVKRAVLQYGLLMVVLLVVHLSARDFFQTAQRYELFALPLAVGAFAALRGRHLAVVKAYVVSASVLAVLWPFAHLLGQKNPVGQMLANAILLLVGVRSLRRYAPLGLVLVPGLILTGSRGAVLATCVGIAMILVLQESRARTAFRRVAVVGLIGFATFVLLPASVQARLTNFTPGFSAPGAYALYVRQQYAADAERIIHAHPYIGIGVGNYLAGDPVLGTQALDPHNVILLQAAEGGYVFALSFVVLIAGTALALRRYRHIDLAPVAAGVLLATVAHGLVDVYWVRGTPILGWLLAGMVLGEVAREHSERSKEHLT